MNLTELKPNETAKIKKITASHKIKTRLFALGVINDQIIEFIRKAPLGDPYQYVISGNFVIIRKSVAKKIEIEVIK